MKMWTGRYRAFRTRRWAAVLGIILPMALGISGGWSDIPYPAPWRALSLWNFDTTNFPSASGLEPRNCFGVQCVPSFRSNAVQVCGLSALLLYNETETNGLTNITCDSGSLQFWFRPDWNSANNGGFGPGAYGRLIELGAYTTNASFGWWSLYFDEGGTNIYFGAQTNGAGATYLSVPIQWSSNWWHLISFSYSSSNSALYLDGEVAVAGAGVSYWPGAATRTNGFATNWQG